LTQVAKLNRNEGIGDGDDGENIQMIDATEDLNKEDNNLIFDINFDVTAQGKLENMARIDKDYEKKFGRLYKTFDVRYLKSKIWESLLQVN
jgi:hypothetical protein